MVIKLEIRSFISGDVDDLSTWCPSLASDVYIHVEMEIGEVGALGAYLFSAIIATPEGLNNHHKGEALKSFKIIQRRRGGGGLVIVNEYNWKEVRCKLEEIVSRCEKEGWDESLDCLRKKFFWEYEK